MAAADAMDKPTKEDGLMNIVLISGYVRDWPRRYLAENGTTHTHFRLDVVHYASGVRRDELYPVQAWNGAADVAAGLTRGERVLVKWFLTRSAADEVEIVATEIYQSVERIGEEAQGNVAGS